MKAGNKLFFIAPFDEEQPSTGLPKYDTTKLTNIKRLQQANLTINGASADSEGDDRVITIEEFSNGKLACMFTELSLSDEAMITGQTYSGDELHEASGVVAPYCGITYAKLMIDDNKVRYYECVYLPMVSAVRVSDNSKSKGRNLTLEYIPMDFDVFECPTGEYRIRSKKDTKAEAESWCKEMLGYEAE